MPRRGDQALGSRCLNADPSIDRGVASANEPPEERDAPVGVGSPPAKSRLFGRDGIDAFLKAVVAGFAVTGFFCFVVLPLSAKRLSNIASDQDAMLKTKINCGEWARVEVVTQC